MSFLMADSTKLCMVQNRLITQRFRPRLIGNERLFIHCHVTNTCGGLQDTHVQMISLVMPTHGLFQCTILKPSGIDTELSTNSSCSLLLQLGVWWSNRRNA